MHNLLQLKPNWLGPAINVAQSASVHGDIVETILFFQLFCPSALPFWPCRSYSGISGEVNGVNFLIATLGWGVNKDLAGWLRDGPLYFHLEVELWMCSSWKSSFMCISCRRSGDTVLIHVMLPADASSKPPTSIHWRALCPALCCMFLLTVKIQDQRCFCHTWGHLSTCLEIKC